MHDILIWAGAILTSYLLGAIPTGFLMVKALKGEDIRKMGSGIMGATNVIRTLGKGPGIATLLIDVLKGALAVLVVAPFWARYLTFVSPEFYLICGLASIAGHNWTCFLNFKGGKGIATSAGVLLALVPYIVLCLVAIWVLTAKLTKYVSAASIAASAALPILLLIFHKPWKWVLAGFILGAVSIWKHRTNIQRLMAGTEHRIGEKA
jgi:glycerol-3-phosphate acyltransferase PlsY